VGEAQRMGLAAPIAWMLYHYLKRVGRRFAKLAEMALNGTLQPPRKRKVPAESEELPPPRPRKKPAAPMWGPGWIVRHVLRAAIAGTRLQALLDEPAMQALMGLDRRLPAIARALCRALGTAPNPGALPPPEPSAPRRRRPAKPKPPKPPPKPRVKKIRWWCAKPPGRGLVFSDPKLNEWPA
jgi:hypothetical protein